MGFPLGLPLTLTLSPQAGRGNPGGGTPSPRRPRAIQARGLAATTPRATGRGNPGRIFEIGALNRHGGIYRTRGRVRSSAAETRSSRQRTRAAP